MHIIIEGPDCSGKTVLAHQLCKMLAFEYHHEGPPPSNKNLANYYCGMLAMLQMPTVLDRFALGERVYGPILRGKDKLGEVGLEKVQQIIVKLNVFQITCLPPDNILWKEFIQSSTREEELLDPMQYQESIHAWVKYCKNTYLYDYTASHALDQLLSVLSYWNTAACLELTKEEKIQ